MNLAELKKYLYDHIPLASAMGVDVLSAEFESVQLSAPLAPNINHRETVFGGSASAVAILAAWTLLHVRLTHAGISSRVVIQRNTMNYQKPIADTFQARAVMPDDAKWDRFLLILQRKQRARISVKVTLHCKGEQVAELDGEFVAIGMLGV